LFLLSFSLFSGFFVNETATHIQKIFYPNGIHVSVVVIIVAVVINYPLDVGLTDGCLKDIQNICTTLYMRCVEKGLRNIQASLLYRDVAIRDKQVIILLSMLLKCFYLLSFMIRDFGLPYSSPNNDFQYSSRDCEL
jgi:hypothetical protein